MKMNRRDSDELPAVIPRVEVVEGEPVIATRHVVEPSPIPRSLAIILIMLAVLSVGYTVFQQEQRRDDVAQMVRADDRADQRFEEILEKLREQDDQSKRERERLRVLVVKLSEADSEGERLELLRLFAAADAADPQLEG